MVQENQLMESHYHCHALVEGNQKLRGKIKSHGPS